MKFVKTMISSVKDIVKIENPFGKTPQATRILIQSKLGDAKSCFYEVIEPDDTFRCYLDIECDQEPSTDWIESVLKLLKKDCVFGGYIKSADINEKYFENMLEPKAD